MEQHGGIIVNVQSQIVLGTANCPLVMKVDVDVNTMMNGTDAKLKPLRTDFLAYLGFE